MRGDEKLALRPRLGRGAGAARILRRLLASLAVVLLVAGQAAAETVDASDSNDVLPKEYDYSLISEDGPFPPMPGKEADLKQQAKLRWDQCLVQFDYARKGSGFFGKKGWVYIAKNDGQCHTIQHTVNGAWHSVADAGTKYHISNLDVDQFMRELGTHFDFYLTPEQKANGTQPDEKKVSDAEKRLAKDQAYFDTKSKGGGQIASLAAGAAASGAVGAGASPQQVAAVTNPSGALDDITNRIKEDSGKAIAEGLGYVSKGMAFDGSLDAFRDAYAAAAGVGLVLLAMTSVIGAARMRHDGRSATEAAQQWLTCLIGGMFGLFFTPAFLYLCSSTADALSDGAVTFLGADSQVITGSLLDPFNALTTANSPLGWLGAILICLLFFAAGIALLIAFAAQYLAAYFGGVGLGVMWGLVHSPSGRKRFRMAVAAVVMAIFARPIMLFMVGVAMKLSGTFSASADGWSTDPMGTLFRLILSVGAILTIVFAPAALNRFMPVGAGAGGGSGRGFIGGMVGGSMAGSMFSGRMHSMAPRIRSAGDRAGSRISSGPGRAGGRGSTRPGGPEGPGTGGPKPSGPGQRASQGTGGRHAAQGEASTQNAGGRSTGSTRQTAPAGARTSADSQGAQGGRTAPPPSGGGPAPTGGAQAASTSSSAHDGGGSQGGATAPGAGYGEPAAAPSYEAGASSAAAPPPAPSAEGGGAMAPAAPPASGAGAPAGQEAPSGGSWTAPGSRLTGSSLVRGGAGRAVTVGGRVAGAAVGAVAVAGAAGAMAARAGAYQGAQFAQTVTDHGGSQS